MVVVYYFECLPEVTVYHITAVGSLGVYLGGALGHFESGIGVQGVGAVSRSRDLAAVNAMAKSLGKTSQQHERNRNRVRYTFTAGSPSTSYRTFPHMHPPAWAMI
jgi:hypothetical protein